jgi:hypothetical protein
MSRNGSHYFLNIFPKRITNQQCKDTGLAMILIALIIGLFSESKYAFFGAGVITIVDMVYPRFFYALAIVWYGLSTAIGTIVSKILLSLLFFILVTPVGLIRKALGSDPMKLREWRHGHRSLFQDRNYTYSSKDIENPY